MRGTVRAAPNDLSAGWLTRPSSSSCGARRGGRGRGRGLGRTDTCLRPSPLPHLPGSLAVRGAPRHGEPHLGEEGPRETGARRQVQKGGPRGQETAASCFGEKGREAPSVLQWTGRVASRREVEQTTVNAGPVWVGLSCLPSTLARGVEGTAGPGPQQWRTIWVLSDSGPESWGRLADQMTGRLLKAVRCPVMFEVGLKAEGEGTEFQVEAQRVQRPCAGSMCGEL